MVEVWRSIGGDSGEQILAPAFLRLASPRYVQRLDNVEYVAPLYEPVVECCSPNGSTRGDLKTCSLSPPFVTYIVKSLFCSLGNRIRPIFLIFSL